GPEPGRDRGAAVGRGTGARDHDFPADTNRHAGDLRKIHVSRTAGAKGRSRQLRLAQAAAVGQLLIVAEFGHDAVEIKTNGTIGGLSGCPRRLRPTYGSGAGSIPSSASSVGARSVCPAAIDRAPDRSGVPARGVLMKRGMRSFSAHANSSASMPIAADSVLSRAKPAS